MRSITTTKVLAGARHHDDRVLLRRSEYFVHGNLRLGGYFHLAYHICIAIIIYDVANLQFF